MVKSLNYAAHKGSHATTCCDQIFILHCSLSKPRHEEKVLEGSKRGDRETNQQRTIVFQDK